MTDRVGPQRMTAVRTGTGVAAVAGGMPGDVATVAELMAAAEGTTAVEDAGEVVIERLSFVESEAGRSCPRLRTWSVAQTVCQLAPTF